MSISIQSTGHAFWENPWQEIQKAALPLTTVTAALVTGIVATLQEVRRSPLIALNFTDIDEERCVEVSFRVEGSAKDGPTNWQNISHVQGEFVHPETRQTIRQFGIEAFPPTKSATHLIILDNNENPALVYRIGKMSNQGLVIEYEADSSEIVRAFEKKSGGKKVINPAAKAVPTRKPADLPPTPPPQKLIARIALDALVTAMNKFPLTEGQTIPVPLKSSDLSRSVTLLMQVKDSSCNVKGLLIETKEGLAERGNIGLVPSTHENVWLAKSGEVTIGQVHMGPYGIVFTDYEVDLHDAGYPKQRRKWNIGEYSDIAQTARYLLTSASRIASKVKINIKTYLSGIRKLNICVYPDREPMWGIGIVLYYDKANSRWTLTPQPSSSQDASAQLTTPPLSDKKPPNYDRKSMSPGAINLGPATLVSGKFLVHPAHSPKGTSFPYHLVINGKEGNAFVIPKKIPISHLTREALDAFQIEVTRLSATRSTPSLGLTDLLASTDRKGFVTVDLLLAPFTLPYHAAKQVNWSAVKNLSLRGGVNLVNFGVPLVGGIGTEMVLKGCETLTGHQFSETTHHVGNLWGLAESGYLWGRYGAPWLKTVVLGAKAANPLTLQALSKTGRGTSYLHFIRGLPAFEVGAYTTKLIGQQFFEIEKGSLADSILGFTGGMAFGMGTELLLQLPRFKQMAPLMTVAGLCYLVVSNSPKTFSIT